MFGYIHICILCVKTLIFFLNCDFQALKKVFQKSLKKVSKLKIEKKKIYIYNKNAITLLYTSIINYKHITNK